ncbi:GNAT family N-acetyltransferase [Vibrio scophthalmi]|uniref:DNA-directed DNA polymerase n=1 Tax=Vibrio scophthalmi TaxID=45658 RepID=A0A1E3WH05_9VIBR|nr:MULTISPECIES: GNAT family N-acetyltransferase [Vibrio]EGU32946.1 GCN5-related N-acetyltransferase [Vibrio sp. N418]MCY9804203.1 GNAT family N-acetyltransferase [Vibrio scophthalmi]ODS05081.1 DNA-directed DNA polymerase [Vibrio scophthalmi]
MQVEFIVDPDESVKQAILGGLRTFNSHNLPDFPSHKVACVANDEQGTFCGGLFGEVYTNTLFIDYFWLDETKRTSGLGRQVFSIAEQQVREMGVTDIYLDTFSFQARGFYLKLGFEEVGRYSGYPMAGVDKIFLQKRIG